MVSYNLVKISLILLIVSSALSMFVLFFSELLYILIVGLKVILYFLCPLLLYIYVSNNSSYEASKFTRFWSILGLFFAVLTFYISKSYQVAALVGFPWQVVAIILLIKNFSPKHILVDERHDYIKPKQSV